MNDTQLTQEAADQICQGLPWNGRHLLYGECVALLDGEVIAVADDLDGALKSLRATDPNPQRGMVFEVSPRILDVIRRS